MQQWLFFFFWSKYSRRAWLISLSNFKLYGGWSLEFRDSNDSRRRIAQFCNITSICNNVLTAFRTCVVQVYAVFQMPFFPILISNSTSWSLWLSAGNFYSLRYLAPSRLGFPGALYIYFIFLLFCSHFTWEYFFVLEGIMKQNATFEYFRHFINNWIDFYIPQ